ncbi:hypothetical protein [Hymenobacter terrenus]|nr:hypothetical protein [Hymenobacter terrenus]
MLIGKIVQLTGYEALTRCSPAAITDSHSFEQLAQVAAKPRC